MSSEQVFQSEIVNLKSEISLAVGEGFEPSIPRSERSVLPSYTIPQSKDEGGNVRYALACRDFVKEASKTGDTYDESRQAKAYRTSLSFILAFWLRE